MSKTVGVERHSFQAEVQQVLDLMIHSLYSNKEIFLRELISNASDACDKLRFEALSDDSLYAGDGELRIEIEVDEDARTLTVRDNGIGMTRDEVIDNIGTIARSGTRKFLQALSGDQQQDARLIGQFGVGFYSAFIVADNVRLLSRRAGTPPSDGVLWESSGTGEYELQPVERERHGTEVTLHLKPELDEFLQDWRLKSLISQYSDHIGFPIRMPKVADDDDQAGGELEWQDVNRASALWTLAKSEISDEDYRGFYQQFAHDLKPPLDWSHNKVEGTQSYTTLLYIPERAPLDLMLNREERDGLKLYVKRVFIMDAAEQLLPHYLRFVRGVVDSDDLPLNVSREILQENALVKQIRASITKRVLSLLEKMAEKRPGQFAQFWQQFGAVLKEGIVEDPSNREKLAGLLRFATTADEGAGQSVSLADYIERMPDTQDTIYYVTADNATAASHSPHLEVFRKHGVEVLLLSDRVDDWMMGYFTDYQGTPLQSVAKGDIDLSGIGGDNADVNDDQPAADTLAEKIQAALGERVNQVRASRRLTESAACLVLGKGDMALHMQRLLKQAGHELPAHRPDLEINVRHPLVQRLNTSTDQTAIRNWSLLLYEQAVLAEGGQLDDPAGFVQRLNRLMLSLQDEEE